MFDYTTLWLIFNTNYKKIFNNIYLDNVPLNGILKKLIRKTMFEKLYEWE